MSQPPVLSLLETRVLGVLSEKQRTVPDSYPLSLNALQAGCNQKTSRDPVLDASESDLLAALESLRRLSLVMESSGGRVVRYAHNIERVLQIPAQSVALLTVLMLRGPQTVAELRLNSERLHKFSDASAVEGFLEELRDRSAGALVQELPRQPGARENRWCHLLSGTPDPAMLAATGTSGAGGGSADLTASEVATLKARVERLEDEMAQMRQLVDRLRQDLGG